MYFIWLRIYDNDLIFIIMWRPSWIFPLFNVPTGENYIPTSTSEYVCYRFNKKKVTGKNGLRPLLPRILCLRKLLREMGCVHILLNIFFRVIAYSVTVTYKCKYIVLLLYTKECRKPRGSRRVNGQLHVTDYTISNVFIGKILFSYQYI